ncbi:hypothetical protein RO3G_05665 [Rhizopus delemar RA 99-880]|uniref:Tc1-like transposase DDE domain-containing protein n=1 Tax=Rhizopus delemar (strain RA 99-880 / ATCC MYA-4621 / FGSC 9543 / NRRL 43880) TaxID=246409 RepID=I1BXN0_RHIO9|nr:hypothetical protein RO3G_05665 [Rhizopus delemar RA 99-880]|eukprot:EIE80960.1 hypothetical protein RO3G_05665 [Rhizopus delemar RA 99-880]
MFTTLSYNKVGKKYGIPISTLTSWVKADHKDPCQTKLSYVIEPRFRAAEAWIKDFNISFMQSCIFIDGSGFNLPTVRSQGRSKKEESANVVVATTRGPSVSILGEIYSLNVNNVGLRVIKTGTKWKELIALHIHVLDVLDKHNLKDCNLVMDNAPIHKPEKSTEEVNKRGSLMTDRHNLVARLREAAEKETPESCQGWIRHFEYFFECCLNK